MRLLFVEDEPDLRRSITRGLTEAGYAVDAFDDGADAWLALATVAYDAAILDVQLPSLDGFSICRRLRTEVESGPPVLFLSARDSIEDRVNGLDLGADDYLVKPFAFAELLARVRALLRKGHRPAPVIAIADLVIDPVTRSVLRGGAPIRLSAKEFAILEYLARNAGAVVSKAMIIEHVWNFELEAESNFIEVFIYSLRKKIDASHDRKLIHTIRGVGYRLDAPA